ncbi:MAG: phenylalanine--tRNA ligase subunit beta, partial [Oscillospiraceae bacterium]|nr:phenylalanine--tRNA ligase subunit beta [Oscillospiraceae bacterium]
MNLSMKWLADYVDLPEMSHRQFAEAMTMSGSKVEGWETECEDVKNVVVAKVLAMEPHPDSDHLWVCQLDCGKGEPVQIVTGAQNVKVGAFVPAALHKSLLPNGTKITKGKLRGVMSNGMMCSLSELNLTLGDFPYAYEDGIFLMEEPDLVPGMPIQEALGLNDTSVEFEITPNRPDCLSVVGLAREAAATFHIPMRQPDESVKGVGDDVKNYLSVSVENKELCKRYAARIVKNVKIGPSPRWIRERLRASGVRPINNIVDITNYVMLEYGQPMHAFDLNYVAGGKIVVRNAKAGESITTLEGVEHPLAEDMLVIADCEKPSAVAGVMGGEYSGINDNTSTIVFESANFHGPSVRSTSRKLGLRTESSGRFEKGLDAQNCIPAINRACHLVELLGIGEVVDGIIDCDNSGYVPTQLELDCGWINHFLGTDLPEEEMRGYLTEAGFVLEGNKVSVPSFRMDVEHKADLAEEVARFYGYNKIPTTISRSNAQGGFSPFQKFENQIHSCMLAQGLNELMTYSFISPKYYDKINLPADDAQRKSVTILNPLGEDTSIMRTNAIPSMLEVLA